MTLQDTASVAMSDLGAQFYLSEGAIGSNRAKVSQEQLSQLNTYVPVLVETGQLTEDMLAKFKVVVLTGECFAAPCGWGLWRPGRSPWTESHSAPLGSIFCSSNLDFPMINFFKLSAEL